MYFDTHCHLTDQAFDADRDAVIQRALEAGVTRMLTLATDVASSRAAIELAERFACVYAAVGIHPESVARAKTGDWRLIRELAQHPKVIAIGEIGLDLYWDKTTAGLQQKFFEQQLELAAELHLPVAIHDRDAHEAVIGTLRRTFRTTGDDGGNARRSVPPRPSVPTTGDDGGNARRSVPPRPSVPPRGVLHAFSGGVEMAHAAFDLGFVVSFGGPITFKNNKHAPEMIRALPLEKILLETDSPYLTPHPLRGKRNEPAHVKLVAQRIAAIQALSIEQVAAQTTRNALELFRLEEL